MMQIDFSARRRELAKRLPTDSVAIIPAASESLRNGDCHYRFRQDSDFHYLTGFDEPEALLVITSGTSSRSILFNRIRVPAEEVWTGPRLGQDAACEVLGVDSAYPFETISTRLPEFLAGKKAIYCAIGRYPHWDQKIQDAWCLVKKGSRRGIAAPEAFCCILPILGEMRLFKEPAEMARLKQAADISVAAHRRAMQACRTLHYEYELEAELLYEFSRQGCRSVAYDSIVAGGSRACTLHYTDNNQPFRDGELVLVDAGGEFENYAADITRTYPTNGHFSHEQRLIYELVLLAQKAGIACIKPGCPWDEVQRVIIRTLTSGLVDLGLLKGSVDDLIALQAHRPFYMHQSGHWLGLDVHDCGSYQIDGQWRSLQPGMVLTVEPGLYIPSGLKSINKRWWGIGVRIEDDIEVTTKGHHNLTGDLAVEVDALEELIRG